MTRYSRLATISCSLMMLVLVPGAHATAPTCNDMNVGVEHNAAKPIFIDCAGGTGAGSPDVLIVSNPTKGSLNPVASQTSTDQWVTYTPNAGQSGADSFTYRGVSPGSGPGPSDELGVVRTVNIRIAPGTPPVCANLSQSVPQSTLTSLRLFCASGGDPIVSFALSAAPAHGGLTTTNLNSGLVGYTSNAGYAGADSFQYRATSTCGAASCQAASASFDLTVLNPQQGPQGTAGQTGATGQAGAAGDPGAQGATGPQGGTGAQGPAGSAGPGGADGRDGAVITRDRLLIASFLDGLSVRRGRKVVLRYVSTIDATVILEVFKGSRRVAAITGRAKAGRNSIPWNGKAGKTAAAPGSYRLVLKATSGDQIATDKASVLVKRK